MALPIKEEEPVSLRTKVLIAGAGALIPIVANLWVVDAALLFQNFTWVAFAGTMTKAFFMFAVGCFFGYLNKSETKLTNLLAVGLSIPSLLVGLANGTQYAKLSNAGQQSPKTSLFALRTVYASPLPGGPPKAFSLPEESATAQFMRGLGLAGSYRGFFVIAAAYANKDDADRAVELVKKLRFDGAVYAPPSGSKVYSVVIGEHKTSAEASDLQAVAVRSGIPHAFVWRFVSNAVAIPPTQIGACAPKAEDAFSLDEKYIHQTSFDAQLYVYANSVHDTFHKATLSIFKAKPGNYPASGMIKDFEQNNRSEWLKKVELHDGKSNDSQSLSGETYRVTVLKTYHLKSGGRADLQVCLVL